MTIDRDPTRAPEVDCTADGAQDPAASLARPAGRRSPRILVVDDQRAVRMGLSRLLATCELRPVVHQAANGDEALALLALHEPDVVVLDVDLNGEDGLALLPRLAARARVLVLTSQTDASTRARAALLGASAFIGKAEAGAVLADHVAELLRGRPQVARGAADTHSRGEKHPMRAREQAPGRRR